MQGTSESPGVETGPQKDVEYQAAVKYQFGPFKTENKPIKFIL